MNFCVLVMVVAPVVTVTKPDCAPTGTVAVMYVEPETTIDVAATPPNFTTDEVLLNPSPRISTLESSVPDVVMRRAKPPKPMSKL